MTRLPLLTFCVLTPPALMTACSEYDLSVDADDLGIPFDCEIEPISPEAVPNIETCDPDPGGFDPIVEWGAGQGQSSFALPAVGDINGDGLPEIVGNFGGMLAGMTTGTLVVLDGHGNELWTRPAGLAYGAGAVLGDIDHDGSPEILVVKALGSQMPIAEDASYSVVAYSNVGDILWESAAYPKDDFDYATGLVISDMDHDGSPEIVAGRVILNSDGSHRGTGTAGRGSWGLMPGLFGGPVSEASVPAVSDLDLDGIEEVITGNAMYRPDGSPKWLDLTQEDGMVGVANLDDDPEGEFVVSSFNTVRAVDTDGTVMWGPTELLNANIVSVPAIADLDADGSPEIVVAGGNALVAFHADGTQMWSAPVQDMSGATGASIFDFESDGIPEVVYIDEQDMLVYDGLTGALKFHNPDHASATMMDYPVIADVDADGQAEIVVAHAGAGRALSVYGDASESWGPARRLWNQHAYSINNVGDNLDIPVDAVPSFTTHNTWHSAIDTRMLGEGLAEMGAEIVGSCDTDCEEGRYYVIARITNNGTEDLPDDIPISLYAMNATAPILLDTQRTTEPTPAGMTGQPVTFEVDASDVSSTSVLRVVADDDGSGLGRVLECDETDNWAELVGPFCD